MFKKIVLIFAFCFCIPTSPFSYGQDSIRVVGQQKTDIKGSTESLSREEIIKALTPDPKSPYKKYLSIRFIKDGDFIKRNFDAIGFRNSKADVDSLRQIKLLSKHFGNDVAVFMDSGGPHSIAMATYLIRNMGYQPIFKISALTLINGSVKSIEEVGSIKFWAPHFEGSRTKNPSGPPVFVMNTHREGAPVGDSSEKNNSYKFGSKHFPNAQELKINGVRKVIWLTEGESDQKPALMTQRRLFSLESLDLQKLFESYAASGIYVSQLRIDPYTYEKLSRIGKSRLGAEPPKPFQRPLPTLLPSKPATLPHGERTKPYAKKLPTYEPAYVDDGGLAVMHKKGHRFILDEKGLFTLVTPKAYFEPGTPIQRKEFYQELIKAASGKKGDKNIRKHLIKASKFNSELRRLVQKSGLMTDK